MTPGVWVVILLIALVAEFITMELYGACISVGAVGALVGYLFGLNIFLQLVIIVAVTGFLLIVVRPVGMKYVSRIKKESKRLRLVGADAVVICAVDNSQGVGVVAINGTQWKAKSHRPNAIIKEGEVVKVVAMNGNVAIVDDMKRRTR